MLERGNFELDWPVNCFMLNSAVTVLRFLEDKNPINKTKLKQFPASNALGYTSTLRERTSFQTIVSALF